MFESLVEVAKKTLRMVVGNAGLTDDELKSAINAVEALMNSRSLTYEGANPRDEPVLTRNHVLVEQLGGQLAPQVTDDIAFDPRNRWRLIQNLVKLFWKRWREESLSTLNTKKWRAAKDNLKVGDCSILVQRRNPFTEHKTFLNHRETRTRGLMPLNYRSLRMRNTRRIYYREEFVVQNAEDPEPLFGRGGGWKLDYPEFVCL